jgi:ABC-type Na+ transport system ATPase subunit NatA
MTLVSAKDRKTLNVREGSLIVFSWNRWVGLKKMPEHVVHPPANGVGAIGAVTDFLLVSGPFGIDVILSSHLLRDVEECCEEVLVLKDMEGQKYEMIAEILQVPVGTIRSRLHRARMELRELLEQSEE